MDIVEAAEQLKYLHQEFIVFSNAQTGEVNVVYRRNDGHVGLIEPTLAKVIRTESLLSPLQNFGVNKNDKGTWCRETVLAVYLQTRPFWYFKA